MYVPDDLMGIMSAENCTPWRLKNTPGQGTCMYIYYVICIQFNNSKIIIDQK